MAVKKRDAIEAVKQAISEHRGQSGVVKIGFVGSDGSAPAPVHAASPTRRTPEFEVGGWQFLAKTGLWEDEPTDGGDADLRAPDGTHIGLVWTAAEQSGYHFDFTPSFGPMLYVDVAQPVTTWHELRLQIEPLVAAIEAEYLQHLKRS
jgi:hypothetical protein